ESLDRQLSSLPEKYRITLVLCDMEGMGHTETARQLGWPVGTVSSRLSRARAMLAKRLARRGITLSVGALATIFARESAAVSMPGQLICPTVLAASLFAAGRSVTAGVVSTDVAALTGEVLKALWLRKLSVAAAMLLMVSATVLALVPLAGQAEAPPVLNTAKE